MTTLIGTIYRKYSSKARPGTKDVSPGITSRFEVFYDESMTGMRVRCRRIKVSSSPMAEANFLYPGAPLPDRLPETQRDILVASESVLNSFTLWFPRPSRPTPFCKPHPPPSKIMYYKQSLKKDCPKISWLVFFARLNSAIAINSVAQLIKYHVFSWYCHNLILDPECERRKSRSAWESPRSIGLLVGARDKRVVESGHGPGESADIPPGVSEYGDESVVEF